MDSKKLLLVLTIPIIAVGILMPVVGAVLSSNQISLDQFKVIGIDSNNIRETADTITIKAVKEERVKIKFIATTFNNRRLDIFLVDRTGNTYHYQFGSDRSDDRQHRIRGTLTLPLGSGNYIPIFLSPGQDKVYGTNTPRIDLIAKYKEITRKTREQVVDMIESDTVKEAGSDDSIKIAKTITVLSKAPQFFSINIAPIRDGIEISGKSNLPKKTKIAWFISGPSNTDSGNAIVKQKGDFSFKISTKYAQNGNYALTITGKEIMVSFSETITLPLAPEQPESPTTSNLEIKIKAASINQAGQVLSDITVKNNGNEKTRGNLQISVDNALLSKKYEISLAPNEIFEQRFFGQLLNYEKLEGHNLTASIDSSKAVKPIIVVKSTKTSDFWSALGKNISGFAIELIIGAIVGCVLLAATIVFLKVIYQKKKNSESSNF